MANSGDDVLKQAHAFIKAGDKKSASKLLKQVLQKDKDNAGAWWLLANAVDNPTHQEKALEQVLRLRPGEKKAQQMLTRLQLGDSIAPPDLLGRESTPVAPLKRTPEKPVVKTSIAEDPFSDDYDYGDPFTDDPFADDPFTDDPFTDDPFVDVGRPARASAQNNRYDSSAYSDDPFGGKNPFAADGFPSRSFQSAPAGQPPKSAPKSSSRSSNPFILAGVATAVIIVIAAVALVVVGLSDNASATTTSSDSNVCDAGVINRPLDAQPTRVACATIERGSVVRGRLNTNEEHAWTFQGRGGESYTITLTGINGGDMYLELYNQAGARIAENDDVDIDNGDFNSRLIVTLTGSEQYTIVARTYSGVTSEAYELRLEG